MNQRVRQLFLLVVGCAAFSVGVWALLRYTLPKRQALGHADYLSSRTGGRDSDLWKRGVEKVKEDRGDTGSAAIEIPAELRHYDDRRWFLATQVAEVQKSNVQSCQDFVDLAAMLERGEMVPLPAVTDTYILFGVGGSVDDDVFSRYVDDKNIELYNESELQAAYVRIESARSTLQTEISSLKAQMAALKKGNRSKQREMQKEITARQQELNANEENKALLDRSYGQPDIRQGLLRDYESLQALAKSFGGRSYNLNDPSDREALKVSMLSSLRPQALKILEEIAKAYRDQFDRPLPVSSLVRPEQYQRALRRVNRNAVLIDTPPHSTGLAFDIDYRYMSGAEQTFIMTQLARLKVEGRIEVLRERSANYHVFAFIDGKRPSDELITASLDQAGAPVTETNHAAKAPAKAKSKSRTAKKAKPGSRAKKTPAKSKAKRRR